MLLIQIVVGLVSRVSFPQMAQKLKKLFGFGEDPVSEDKKLWGLAPNVNGML